MAIFSDCSVVLDLKNVPIKEKKKLMTAIVDNGGNISYVVNKKCSFVVASSLENVSSSRWRSAQKHQKAVVGLQYVWSCLEKGTLLPVQEHVLKPKSSDLEPEQAQHSAGVKSRYQTPLQNSGIHDENGEVKDGTYLGRFRYYKENDHDIPEFSSDFQVAKFSILTKAQPQTWSVLELQSAKGEAGQQYRVVSAIMHEAEKSVVWDKQVHSSSSEDAVEAYLMLSKELHVQGFTQTQTLPPWAEKLTSHSLQQLLLEDKLNCSTVSQEVGSFVELIWTEALGSLSIILTVPVTSISLNDVSRVEGLLLQVQKSQCEDEVKGLLEEVNTLLPVRITEPDSKNKLVSQKLDLCQLIRDILNMTETTSGNPFPSSLGKYRALRCSIEQVPSQSPEFLSVCQLLQDRPAQIQQILRVSRGTELHMFRNELGNIKPLLHSTASSSLVGILSRGLLLPKVGVEQHGIERTDIGNLGSGIYFSDSLNTSVKYSKPSVADGCRLLLVCEVALGQCKDLHKRDFTLTSAPQGYNSVHGVQRTQKTHSDFEDDEYVVYDTDQIKLKYVVQYFLPEDEVKDFQPYVDTTLAPPNFASSSHLLSSDDGEGLGVTKNPLEEVTAGLLDSNGQTLPLQAVHVRCKLVDLLSQVIIFQTYTNNSSVPIEAKYVFPLEETAAVCGFEAFINGKHIIGKVKEKEQARKEYRQAIEKGHGAYLMDQDAPDVFTISVGNLPPGATVLIKVTFITELVVRAGTIIFSLPGSVAPWQQSSALNQRTQTTVEKVCVNELQPEGEFSLCMSIEMPYKIINLECSHQIKIKRTDCKAVVSTLTDQTLSTDGFRLSFTLFQIHMPRMWVEKHPEKDTEACMLVFYPHFESSGVSVSDVSDVIILLDTSESMRGDPMLNARRIALKVLNSLDRSLRVNIISFGSEYKEAFPSPNVLEEVFEEAKNFIMFSDAVGGSTELWRPLRTLSLLPPSRGMRNILLISDGHVQNQPPTLQLVRDNVRHTRLFTSGLNLTANRYMLRALAQAGGGTYEFFDTKTKHNWAEKVRSQVKCMVSPGCSSVAIKWQQFSLTAPTPVQAPSQLHALFSDCHTLVYGFVPHCTQATLFGDRSGQEIETMVSTTELQKTKGTFLHKLTARAIIRDYEDGSLGANEAEHEGKKAELKSYIIELSKEFSILSQFTSFVAIEERDQDQADSGFTDIPKIIEEEDVDILSYVGWTEYEPWRQESSSESDLLEADAAEYSQDLLMLQEEAFEAYDEPFVGCSFASVYEANDNLSPEHEGSFEGLACIDSSVTMETRIPRLHQRLMQAAPLTRRQTESFTSSECQLIVPMSEEFATVNRMEERSDLCDILPSHSERAPYRLSMPAAHIFSDPVFTSDTLILGASASPPGFEFGASPLHHKDGRASLSPPSRGSLFYRTSDCSIPAPYILRARDSSIGARAPPPPPPPSLPSVPPPPSVGSADHPHPTTVGFGVFAPSHSSGFTAPAPPSVDIAASSSSMVGLGSFAGYYSSEPEPQGLIRDAASSSSVDYGVTAPLRKSFEVSFGASTLRRKVARASPPPPPPPSLVRPNLLNGSLFSSTRDSFTLFGASASTVVASGAPPPPPPPPAIANVSYNLTPDLCYEPFAPRFLASAPPPPPPPPSVGLADRPRGTMVGFGVFAPSRSSDFTTLAPASVERAQSCGSVIRDPVSPSSVDYGVTASIPKSFIIGAPLPPSRPAFGASARPRAAFAAVPSGVFSKGERVLSKAVAVDRSKKRLGARFSTLSRAVPFEDCRLETSSINEQYRRPDRINWEELFNLQHQDGYWECTGTLSRFLGLDVDFFANVFLKEKGICSLGAKAHADILKLVATLLVLQLMRVMKMAEGELFQSLFRLSDHLEPRPACWEAVKRAVEWVCWADRQYPCVCSRLEFGWDWESCTRQLLGVDMLPPFSPLIPVLHRNTHLPVSSHF